MKLLYLWVNCSKNGFIEKKGFNISGEYYWKYDEEKRTLYSVKKVGYIKNFWNESSNSIEDLSVIVGTNGSGKSTLLSEIMRYDVIGSKANEKNNSNVRTRRKITEQKIIVYEEDGYMYYYHNLEYEIKTVPVTVLKKKDTLMDDTKIYVSNSANNSVKELLYVKGDVIDYALTDYIIQDHSKIIIGKNKIPDYVYESKEKGDSRYYDDPSTHHEENKIIQSVKELNDRVAMSKDTYRDFNSLIKLYFLVKSNCNNYVGKTFNYVTIKIKTKDEIFKGDNFGNFSLLDEDIWMKTEKLERKEKESILFNALALCFLHEYQYCYQYCLIEEVKEISLSQIERISKTLQEHTHRDIKESLQENMTTDEYFINAANDLILFHRLLQDNNTILSGRFYGEKPYLEEVRVDLNKNMEFFDRLFLFFERGIPSIFMRYLTFEFEGMSSGEEAMLNLYSRIFWLYNAQHCRKESLILIDEIDLYMHPKWQRGLISYLVEDIPNLIGEGNKAQIIITTHSPIILSDVPRANTIFLENRNGKCIVDNNLSHRDTFGNNVHTLFLDSFFLDDEGTMGEFAEKKINGILKLFRSGERINDEDKTVLKIIKCIGDDLIRNKLLEMYEKNQGLQQQLKEIPTFFENTAIDNTIAVLRSQVAELLRTIEQLEQIKND